jgi:hypothetical protein
MTSTTPRKHRHSSRRSVVATLLFGAVAPAMLMGCSPAAPSFDSTDITGAAFAKDFGLQDHHKNLRTMADFRGKIVVVFFGFTQCPDVCPTSMTTMAEVKRLLGNQGHLLQVVFITVDPERDTLSLLMAGSRPRGGSNPFGPALASAWLDAGTGLGDTRRPGSAGPGLSLNAGSIGSSAGPSTAGKLGASEHQRVPGHAAFPSHSASDC